MSNKKRVLLIAGLFYLFQVIVFRDYITPIQWGQIKVSGLICTCPDESVINGQLYLRLITPDSLKKYNLDYSEIYVTEYPSTDFDPMGADDYILTGCVIGKDRVYEGDSWNPKFKVDSWRAVDLHKDWIIKGVLFFEFIILVILLIKTKKEFV